MRAERREEEKVRGGGNGARPEWTVWYERGEVGQG